MMQILSHTGDPDIARVFVVRFRGDPRLLAEFVDARDPELPPAEKWVVIVSTQFGCPVGCPMCDAGGEYRGDLTAEEMLAQVAHVVAQHPPARLRSAKKFKIQFARMGEPALNPAVLEALELLPRRFEAPGLIPCVATVAPAAARAWFEDLLEIRRTVYGGRPFQLQLSINSTDDAARERLMPLPKLPFRELARYARRIAAGGPRKVVLNFALTEGIPVDPATIARHFDPDACCVKLTPLNPTVAAEASGLATALPPDAPAQAQSLCDELARRGFDVILSIGDARENAIGSNCGMAVRRLTTANLLRIGQS